MRKSLNLYEKDFLSNFFMRKSLIIIKKLLFLRNIRFTCYVFLQV